MHLKYKIDKKAIGKRLKAERIRIDQSQEKLSEAIGITPKYLSKIENGASTPSLALILKFAEVTGSDLNYVLRGGSHQENEYPWMLREQAPVTNGRLQGLSPAGRRICDGMLEKLKELLKDNNV